MAAKVDRRRCHNKRRLPSIGGESLKRYNLRKKRKVQEDDDSSLRSGYTILEVSLGFGKYSSSIGSRTQILQVLILVL